MKKDNSDLTLIDDIEISAAKENRIAFEDSIAKAKSAWFFSPKGKEAHRAIMSALPLKTGMFARIPIICKGEKCPYAELCNLLPFDLAPEGEYCPQETAQIEMRTAEYAADFDIDSMSFTDKTLLNEIIGLDIMLERCRALMAKEGSPVQDITIGVADDGTEIKQQAVSKAWEAYEKMSKKRDADYQLMMMTRKDNKNKIDDNVADNIYNILNTITVEDINSIKKE